MVGTAGSTIAKLAVTEMEEFIVTSQVPVPAQPPPLQPENVAPGAADALKDTAVPVAKLAEHVAPQSMPAGVLMTVPPAEPAFDTVNALAALKVAVMLREVLMVNVH